MQSVLPNLYNEIFPRLCNSGMADSKRRLTSFSGWPLVSSPCPQQLVECGFYYCGVSDRIRCFACGLYIEGWKPWDDPWLRHRRYAPDCSFLEQQNRATGQQNGAETLHVDVDSVVAEAVKRKGVRPVTLAELHSILRTTDRSKRETDLERNHSSQKDFLSRQHFCESEETFDRHIRELNDSEIRQRVEIIEFEERQRRENVMLMERHRNEVAEYKVRHRREKDEEISRHVEEEAALEAQQKRDCMELNAEYDPPNASGFLTCSICIGAQKEVVFLPCGHFTACSVCARKLLQCPACRGPIDDAIKTFIA